MGNNRRINGWAITQTANITHNATKRQFNLHEMNFKWFSSYLQILFHYIVLYCCISLCITMCNSFGFLSECALLLQLLLLCFDVNVFISNIRLTWGNALKIQWKIRNYSKQFSRFSYRCAQKTFWCSAIENEFLFLS